MSSGTPESARPRANADADGTDGMDGIVRGVWAGGMPLALALIVVGLAAGGAALARALIGPAGADGFLAWQGATIAIWGAGLVLAAIVYGVSVARALRWAARWRGAGLARQAEAVYWSLLVIALLLLTPVIVALALPQHPAP